MPDTTSYQIDPVTKAMTSVGAPGKVDVTNGGGGSSLGSLAPHPADPYSIFNSRLADMLQVATNQSMANNKLLGGAKDTLTTTSVAPGGVQPFNPAIFSGSQVSGQETMQKAFEPAITSISTQQANTAAATQGIKETIGALQAATQPITLQPGQSLVSRDGTVLKAGHSYTPQINPLSGLMDGFDQNTGSWASQDTSNEKLTPPPASNSDLVGGVDFSGTATSTKPYATDPNYSAEVDGLYTQIKRISPIPTAQTIDQFIASQVGGKGNVTGQMIMAASAQYGIDPNMLAAVLGHESDFGTAGAAVKTMNAGNVGNTGTSTQTFSSWQQGVNSAAFEIARRMPGNKNALAGPVNTGGQSPIGGQFSPTGTSKVKQLPQYMQNYADAGPGGVAYINDDRVPTNVRDVVKTMASRAGIPYLTGPDVANIHGIQNVFSQLDQMQSLAAKALGSGVTGRLQDKVLGAGASALQTDWGNQLNNFNNYRETAVNLVRGLAGGAGLRINGAEIAANVEGLPSGADSVEGAFQKIATFENQTYAVLAATFPYVKQELPQLPIGHKAGDHITVNAGNSAGMTAGNYVVGFDGTLYPTK